MGAKQRQIWIATDTTCLSTWKAKVEEGLPGR